MYLKQLLVGVVISGMIFTVEALGESLEESVPMYGLFELKLSISQGWSDPFDSSDIKVDAEITRPDEKIDLVPCYYHADQDWRLRYSPTKPGVHHIRVSSSLKGAEPGIIQEATFEAVASNEPGYIKVHPENPYYFSTARDEVFYPIGENLAWIDLKRENFRAYLDKLSANKANWVRLWMVFWGLTDLEWNAWHSKEYRNLEGYSLENAERIDQIFRDAHETGMYIQLVINHHGQYSTEVNPNWDSNPYNKANGGVLENPKEFFTHPKMKKRYKDRLRYLVARWGWSQNLFAWELWNEVYNTDAIRNGTPAERRSVLDWHIEMARYLKDLDPYDHLLTTSGCIFDDKQWTDRTWGLPEFDFNQAHDYVSNIIDRIRSLSIRMREYRKPFFHGEIGINEVEWPAGKEAIPLHDMLWTSLVSPQAGTAMTWYWDLNVERYNSYFHFRPVAEVAGKIHWAKEDPLPIRVDWISKGAEPVDLILHPGIGWGRSEVADIPVSSTSGGPAMGSVSRYLQGTGKPDMRVNPAFHLDVPSPVSGQVVLFGVSRNGGSLLVKLDGEKVDEIHFPPREQKEDEVDLRKDSVRIVFVIPQGKHSLVLENPGTDWVDIEKVVFEKITDRVQVLGQAGKTQVLLWIRDRTFQSEVAESWDDSRAIPEVRINVRDVSPGTYSVTRWDTRTGQTWDLGSMNSGPSGGQILLENVNKDAFLLLEKKDQ